MPACVRLIGYILHRLQLPTDVSDPYKSCQKLRATHTSTAQNIRCVCAEIDGFHKETADMPLHADVTLLSEAQVNRWAM